MLEDITVDISNAEHHAWRVKRRLDEKESDLLREMWDTFHKSLMDVLDIARQIEDHHE